MNDDIQTGYDAPVYRALYLKRQTLGLSRELCAFYWGIFSIPILCFHIWWVLIPAVIGHGVLAWVGKNNPDWFGQLKRKFHHADVYTRGGKRAFRGDATTLSAARRLWFLRRPHLRVVPNPEEHEDERSR
jgi:hypothetical protein